MSIPELAIRPARTSDHASLLDMQARSIRQLGRGCYSARAVESYLDRIGTMDRVLLEDGTFWVVVHGRQIAASGGWSLRPPGYASCDKAPARAAPAERVLPAIRSVFVDPAYARRGLGRMIMARVEAEIVAAGFAEAELVATLNAVAFYAARGFAKGRMVNLQLEPDLWWVGQAMAKVLAMEVRRAA